MMGVVPNHQFDQARVSVGLKFLQEQKWGESLKAFNGVTSYYGKELALTEIKSYVLMKLNRVKEAKDLLRKAIKLSWKNKLFIKFISNCFVFFLIEINYSNGCNFWKKWNQI